MNFKGWKSSSPFILPAFLILFYLGSRFTCYIVFHLLLLRP